MWGYPAIRNPIKGPVSNLLSLPKIRFHDVYNLKKLTVGSTLMLQQMLQINWPDNVESLTTFYLSYWNEIIKILGIHFCMSCIIVYKSEGFKWFDEHIS